MKRELNVTIIQSSQKPFKLKENLENSLNLASMAVKNDCDLLVFPELFDSGYNVKTKDENFSIDFSNLSSNLSFQSLFAFAKKHKIIIVACSIERYKNKFFDTAYILNKDGLLGKYRKTHLWADENQRFSKGNNYPVFKLKHKGFSFNLGLLICYEIGFSELARILALKKAEILVYPSAFGKARAYAWDLASRARALENACFVLACNTCKSEFNAYTKESLHFAGRSKIINPRGEILAELGAKEGFIKARIDLNEVKTQRKNIPYLKDLNLSLIMKNLKH